VLLVNGVPVQIGSRAFELLLTLVRRRGTVVGRSELLEAVWPGLFVEENNIAVQVNTLRKLLGAKTIVTVPGRGYQLSADPIAEEEASVERPTSASNELFGRDGDLVVLSACLVDARLTTIVGPGGVGKTVLARAAFARHWALLHVPSYWIDLSPIREARQVVPLIAKSLGVEMNKPDQAAAGLMAALGQTEAFVALDNCEHLINEVSRFMGMALQGAPRLRWLTTSREPLRVPGETTHRLEPLSVPVVPVNVMQALKFGSLALLCKRVSETDRHFSLDDRNLAAAVELCAQLDGLPLAIEMAANRVATFGLEDVSRRLGQRLKLLKASSSGRVARHETLQATYDWSYSLLSKREQAVFRRLGPFLGGFRADMAQRVVSDEDEGGSIDSWAALDAIGALVEKSLVQRAVDEPGRFFLLESARDYACTCLEAAGETDATLRRHTRAVAEWFDPVQSDADRMTDAQWVRCYSPERHNARAALAWACEKRSADDAAQLVTALSMMDWMLCRQAEVLQSGVPLDLLAEASPARRAAAYLEFSWAHSCDGSHALGAQLSQEAFDIFTSLGESARAYRALAQLVRLHHTRPGMSGDARAAWAKLEQLDDRQLSLRTRLFCAISAGLVDRPEYTVERLEELRQLAEESGFESIAAICGCNLTNMLLIARRYEEVVDTADRLLRFGGQRPRANAFTLHNKACALISLGRVDEACEAARLAFQAMPAVAHFLVDSFAFGAAKEGRLADAALLLGCGNRVREENHEVSDEWEAKAIADTVALLESGLNPEQLRELLKLGAAMSTTELLEIKVFARARQRRATAARAAGVPGPMSSVGFQ
jgi:predicted ATPase